MKRFITSYIIGYECSNTAKVIQLINTPETSQDN